MFLCPRCIVSRSLRPNIRGLLSPAPFQRPLSALSTRTSRLAQQPSIANRRNFQATAKQLDTSTETKTPPTEPLELDKELLPICCPGCGAYSQTIDPNEPGYYSKTRKKTRKVLNKTKRLAEERDKLLLSPAIETSTGNQDAESASGTRAVEDTAPKPAHGALVEEDVVVANASRYAEENSIPSPVCDRCHNLIHHNQGVAAPSPTIYSIRELLNESPHKRNRVYHVIDAADFPMSLIPDIYDALSLQEQRSKNRRAKTAKYLSGKLQTTISFIITRSDLLAATKEQVDSKMNYIRNVLLNALDQDQEDIRFGNVHMISAHRGWWTKSVKDEIKEHGGGIWVVGKANVGKSSFIEVCFPKDSKNLEKLADLLEHDPQQFLNSARNNELPLPDEDSLLPPAPREGLYPTLPVVSSLPGTTVSPIRIPFGHGRGEMIDLPGLERESLHQYVREEHQSDLIMTKRVKPERITIKPGQSLLLGGGLVRITPVNIDDVVMAASFVPIETHVTRTEKAVEIQTGERAYAGTNIIKEEAKDTISSAGIFELKWDVTHSHLPRSAKKLLEDQGIPPPPLPYKVLSADILIEGCGWLEITTQVRARTTPGVSKGFPRVEVFSPHGKHIGIRSPMEAYEFIAQKKVSDKRKKGSRPARQNIGLKKRASHTSKL
ncbi:Mitochondrial ribosome small subunit biogenesis protein [Paecilomyces lecythidis]|uniref:Mitochondrial ribosome small subunit biogenesis protein n=1 Tax=Paecilomyces lecythidis TaxID=3004212 RepID=A0ABR3XBW8_9EURO